MTPAEARGLLGLSHDAGLDEVQAAYKKRSQFMHPDRFAGRPEGEIRFATAEFQRLGKARDLLREALSKASGFPQEDHEWDHRPEESAAASDEAPATSIAITIPRDQAVAGNVILVHTPAGEAVRLRLPHTVQSSTTIRVRGRGDGVAYDGARNDLLVFVQLAALEEEPRQDRNARYSQQAHFDNPQAEGGIRESGYGNAKRGLSGTASLGVAASIVSAIVLIGVTVLGIPAPNDSNEAPVGSSIEFALEPDSGAACPTDMAECWIWTITPEESCSYATVTIELSESETSPASQRTQLYGETLVAGSEVDIFLNADNVEHSFASITSITCQGT